MVHWVDGQKIELKKIEKHHKGYIENEVWTCKNNELGNKLNPTEMLELGIEEVEDFSDIWNDFIIFPVKNSTESDSYFGESDYKRCKSIVEEIMLTVSQNSKIINRHANPKLSGSEQNLEYNPETNARVLPNTDFIKIGTDGVKVHRLSGNLERRKQRNIWKL